MKNPWVAYLFFIPSVVAVLIALTLFFPDTHGKILGQEPEAWLGDMSGQRRGGRGGENRPPAMDVDYIKVKGRWYKIKGPVYLTPGGKILGWHQETTFQETGYVGKWASFLE